MKHGSLFSGMGGPDLAAEWMGWENVFHCEWNPFGQRILKYYWPKAISYEDITKTDFTIHRGQIDIITGGFPCQPYSTAGLRKGKEDERHLWPEMLRAIREIKPRWIVGENVLGLVGWNDGMVFEEVQADLEAEGYEVQPYILPACAKNAPHRRERVWFVAYSTGGSERPSRTSGETKENRGKNNDEQGCRGFEGEQHNGCSSVLRNSTDAPSKGLQEPGQARIIKLQKENRERLDCRFKLSSSDPWELFPTQSPVCDGDDGLSSRLDGITFPKWRTESIKAGGNAIVPQVVHQIFKAIEEYENIQPGLK